MRAVGKIFATKDYFCITFFVDPHTHEFLTIIALLLHTKSEQKVIGN